MVNLPPLCTEKEIAKHFDTLLGHKSVASVTIAYDNEKEIEAYRTRGQLIRNRTRQENEIFYYASLEMDIESAGGPGITLGSPAPFTPIETSSPVGSPSTGAWRDVESVRKPASPNTLRGLRNSVSLSKAKIDNLEQRLNKKQEKRNAQGERIRKLQGLLEIDKSFVYHGKPVCAFVIFEKDSTRNQALALYHLSISEWFFFPPAKLFKGYRLSVNSGPEPSTILWENLQYNKWQRSLRRSVSLFFVCIFLVVAIFAAFTSRILQQITRSSGGYGVCPPSWRDMSSRLPMTNIYVFFCVNAFFSSFFFIFFFSGF